MSAKDILKILKNADLLKRQKRLEKLMNLSNSEYSLLLDEFDRVAQRTITHAPKNTTLTDLYLPYVSENIFSDIPGYLFLFEKVHLLEPLYDYFSWLEQDNEQMNALAKTMYASVTGKNYSEVNTIEKLMSETSYERKFRQVSVNKVNDVIEKYFLYQDLIEQGAIEFYYDTTQSEPNAEAWVHLTQAIINSEFDNAPQEAHDKLTTLRTLVSSRATSIPKALDDGIQLFVSDEFLDIEQDIWRLFYTSLNFKSIFPSENCSNIDFGNEKNKHLLDKIVEFGSKYIDKDLVLDGIKWPQPEDELIFTLLSGIPPQELLSIRDKEKSSLDNFRYGMQRKIVEIREAVGTKEYRKLINLFQFEQKKEVTEIKLLSEHIKSKYLKQTANNILIATASAAAAILSASVAVNDPISLLGIGIGSAGATTGLSKLIETWIEYSSELDKLKEKDAYVLWKVQSSKKREPS